MRPRTPSGHDIPIPESVYQGMQLLDSKIEGVRSEVAGLSGDVAEINTSLKAMAGQKAQTWVDFAKVLAPVALAIIGAQQALAYRPPPPPVEVHYTPVTPAMAPECMSIQPGTQAQAECFARVQAEIQSGRRPAARP